MSGRFVKPVRHLLIVAVIIGIIAAISPLLDNPRYMSALNHITFNDVAMAIILAVSLNLILGMTGQFSLGHAGFVAAGAYTAAVVAGKAEFFLPQLNLWHTHLGLGIPAAFACITVTGILAAMLVAAFLGLLVGLPTLRLRGDYLAIATLGFGEIVATLITNSEYLGRANGFRLETMWQLWLVGPGEHSPLAAQIAAYKRNSNYFISSFWVLLAVFGTILVVRNIKYSTTGRALLAIREDGIASEAVGVPTVRYKITAFVIGAAMAGAAGGIMSHYTALNPTSYRFMYSVTIVLFVILGGQGSITGSAVAAATLTILPVAIQRNTLLDPTVTEKWRMVVYALLIILAMLFMPRGIFGRYEITDLYFWLLRRLGIQRRIRPVLKTVAAASGPYADGPAPPAGPPALMLNIDKMTMQFGGLRAVDEFSLQLHAGELVGLIGPNGAGKTTVFNVLTGVYRPTRGGVQFGSHSLKGLKPHAISKLGVAQTFQNIRLFATLSVRDNVMIAQHARHRKGIFAAVVRSPDYYAEEERARAGAMEFLHMFNLAHLANDQANSLCYGDQRRLEIARALATRPRLLLLDEPAAGMNPTEKRDLMEMIGAIRRRFGLTILLIEHDMKLVMGVCERIVVLDYGRTIASGTPSHIRHNPAVIEAYLGAGTKQG